MVNYSSHNNLVLYSNLYIVYYYYLIDLHVGLSVNDTVKIPCAQTVGLPQLSMLKTTTEAAATAVGIR